MIYRIFANLSKGRNNEDLPLWFRWSRPIFFIIQSLVTPQDRGFVVLSLEDSITLELTIDYLLINHVRESKLEKTKEKIKIKMMMKSEEKRVLCQLEADFFLNFSSFAFACLSILTIFVSFFLTMLVLNWHSFKGVLVLTYRVAHLLEMIHFWSPPSPSLSGNTTLISVISNYADCSAQIENRFEKSKHW